MRGVDVRQLAVLLDKEYSTTVRILETHINVTTLFALEEALQYPFLNWSVIQFREPVIIPPPLNEAEKQELQQFLKESREKLGPADLNRSKLLQLLYLLQDWYKGDNDR